MGVQDNSNFITTQEMNGVTVGTQSIWESEAETEPETDYSEDESYIDDSDENESFITDDDSVLEDESMFSNFTITGGPDCVTVVFTDFRCIKWKAVIRPQDLDYKGAGNFKGLVYCVFKSCNEKDSVWEYSLIGLEVEGNETRLVLRETENERRRFYIGLDLSA